MLKTSKILLYFCLYSLALSILLLVHHTKTQYNKTIQPSLQFNTNSSDHSITASITTNVGIITIGLDAKNAPNTVRNFIQYVESGAYNNTIFHRVIRDFMVQGGGYSSDFKKITQFNAINNEANRSHPNTRGTIAMARSQKPHSARSQFFINISDNQFLDIPNGYAVFGEVVSGMEVIDYINTVPTSAAGPFEAHVPDIPITIETITLNFKEESSPPGTQEPEAK